MTRMTRMTRLFFSAVLLAVSLTLLTNSAISAEESKAVSLFDGKTLDGWVTGAGAPVKAGWVVEDGTLHRADKGGDIYATKEYGDFILTFDFKISEAGNSGLKYRFGKYASGNIGCEYQVLDDAKHPDAKVGKKRQTASLYDILEPNDQKELKAVGEWNSAKIVAKGAKIEHWLNGKKVLDIDLNSPEFKEALAKSKFKKSEDFGTKPGKIMLQDHGDKVWFRKIMIEEIK